MLQITFYSFGFRSFDSSIILTYILYSTYAKLTFGERFCKINFCHTSFRTFWDEFSYMLVMIDSWTTILIIFWENLFINWLIKILMAFMKHENTGSKTTCFQITTNWFHKNKTQNWIMKSFVFPFNELISRNRITRRIEISRMPNVLQTTFGANEPFTDSNILYEYN